MKKSIYDHFNYSVYKYAPESFKLLFRGKTVELPNDIKDKLGYLAITDKKSLLKALKQFIRNESIFSQKINSKYLAIRTNESKNSYIKISNAYGYGKVNRYSIDEKLMVYKELKEAYNKNNFNIEVTAGTMQKDGKMSKGIKQEISKPELLKRILFV